MDTSLSQFLLGIPPIILIALTVVFCIGAVGFRTLLVNGGGRMASPYSKGSGVTTALVVAVVVVGLALIFGLTVLRS